VGSGSTGCQGGALPLSLQHRQGGEVRIASIYANSEIDSISLCPTMLV